MQRAILVKSCQRFRKRREACEATWAGALRSLGCLVWFASGNYEWPSRGCHSLQMKTGDTYQDNSIKLREALKLILAPEYRAPQDCRIFICDDDTFVHPRRWLAHEPSGHLECRAFRPPHKKHDMTVWIHGGPGWWMSRELCELYVKEATERTSADDILVAKIAFQHGIEMVDRPDLYGGDRYSGHNPPERVSADNSLITCHHVQPEEMVKLWEETRRL